MELAEQIDAWIGLIHHQMRLDRARRIANAVERIDNRTRLAEMADVPGRRQWLLGTYGSPEERPYNRGTTMAPNGKRTGLMRAHGTVKASGAGDYEMERLADMVEQNNARTLKLASDGVDREQTKQAILDQIEREHALDELEKAMGSNFGPPLSDSGEIEKPTTDSPTASTPPATLNSSGQGA